MNFIDAYQQAVKSIRNKIIWGKKDYGRINQGKVLTKLLRNPTIQIRIVNFLCLCIRKVCEKIYIPYRWTKGKLSYKYIENLNNEDRSNLKNLSRGKDRGRSHDSEYRK